MNPSHDTERTTRRIARAWDALHARLRGSRAPGDADTPDPDLEAAYGPPSHVHGPTGPLHPPEPAFLTCPRCQQVTTNPDDVLDGWCPVCGDYVSDEPIPRG
jgi:hypothetical protein